MRLIYFTDLYILSTTFHTLYLRAFLMQGSGAEGANVATTADGTPGTTESGWRNTERTE
jgi:hypothetical protein